MPAPAVANVRSCTPPPPPPPPPLLSLRVQDPPFSVPHTQDGDVAARGDYDSDELPELESEEMPELEPVEQGGLQAAAENHRSEMDAAQNNAARSDVSVERFGSLLRRIIAVQPPGDGTTQGDPVASWHFWVAGD
jgi:hypothetical protein